MNKSTDKYTYRVTWSEEDQEYVGLCSEFPSLSWLEQDQIAALNGIRKLVSDTVADMQAANETIPEPFSIRDYSGKVLLRVPPETHRHLVIQAAESGVSLNRYIASKLH
ncbi:toxin-antitoxin system HicB family antitoxin [Endozoicomonas sp. GU-1]|uniref:type II toxin-antitoxin system HicB family antitoxin n=1 Tax=Endozoicomonas sp. GU-1 TaxID=3009078 RepID=UPI0022B58F74|nr:toxin-antitoxin system HicB family antitoxin [Endozoicomonas sp. GU-1]WBA83224.1 toxin-antitoxin system HicB family antitoxin [Endozoicomonas sp. GU-1]WBA86149.1 toxin-antitoxin system HicB family antitoxin [Endozoicomonas sp. GU-1]